MSGSTIMVHIDAGERVWGEVRLLYPPGDPLLELTFQVGHRERVSLLWRGKGAIGEARAVLRGMELLAGKIEADAEESMGTRGLADARRGGGEMKREAVTVGDLIGLRRSVEEQSDAAVWEEAMRRKQERAQEVREQEAAATPAEAQEGPQAPLAASEGGARAGGGAIGALEGSESPSRGILATPAEEEWQAKRLADVLRPEPQATPAGGNRSSGLLNGLSTGRYSWTGTDRECPDCGGLLPLWHEPDCYPEWRIREARRASCWSCGIAGYHVDTTAGEIVRNGEVVAAVKGELLLMADEHGKLICDDCAESGTLGVSE